MSAIVCSLNILWHCPSLGLEWKRSFSSPVALLSFPDLLAYIECSTLTSSSFRIWNSSARIPSLLLALSIVRLPKAHLTSHSRLCGSRWVVTPLWLSRSLRLFFFFFFYNSSVYSFHVFLISSASVRSIPFLSFIKPIFAWNAPLVSLNFLEENFF